MDTRANKKEDRAVLTVKAEDLAHAASKLVEDANLHMASPRTTSKAAHNTASTNKGGGTESTAVNEVEQLRQQFERQTALMETMAQQLASAQEALQRVAEEKRVAVIRERKPASESSSTSSRNEISST